MSIIALASSAFKSIQIWCADIFHNWKTPVQLYLFCSINSVQLSPQHTIHFQSYRLPKVIMEHVLFLYNSKDVSFVKNTEILSMYGLNFPHTIRKYGSPNHCIMFNVLLLWYLESTYFVPSQVWSFLPVYWIKIRIKGFYKTQNLFKHII